MPLLGLIALSGCAGASSSSGDAQVPPGTVTIGFPSDLTRDGELVSGAKIGVDEINGLGGIDGALKIRLLIRDTRGRPKRAARVTRSLIRDGARVVIVPCDARSAIAVVNAARNRRVLLLGTCNHDPALVARTPTYWAVDAGANVEAAALVDYAAHHGYVRLHLDVGRQLDARMLARYLRAAAASRGIDVVANPRQASAIVDVRPTIPAARNRPPRLATDLVTERDVRAVDGIVFTTFAYPDPGFATDEFYERYRAHHGVRPSSSRSILAYAAIKLFERAVNKGDSARLGAVTTKLRGLDWDSPLGHADYRHGRNPHVKVPIIQVQNGRLVLVTRAAPEKVPAP